MKQLCKYLPGVLIALSVANARADVPLPPLSGVEKATIEKPLYPTLRLNDIAPMFALPDANGKLQLSTTHLGEKSLLVVTLNTMDEADSDDARRARALRAFSLATALKDAIKRVAKLPVDIVAIAPPKMFQNLRDALGGIDAIEKLDNFKLLRDDAQDWSRAIDAPYNSISIAAIDKAGFLRRLENADSDEQLAAQLRALSDVTPRLEIGRAAPDWSVVDFQNRVRRLGDYRGQKNVLLTFFPKCFTGGCANHLRSLNETLNAFASNDTQIIAVSFDSAEGERGQIEFAQQLNLGFPLIPDTGRNLALLYEAAFSPQQPAPSRMTFLIDKDGVLRTIDREVQTLTHGPDTIAKMRELGMIQ